MFRAIICSSSGSQIVYTYMQHLVSSLSLSRCGGHAVHRYCVLHGQRGM